MENQIQLCHHRSFKTLRPWKISQKSFSLLESQIRQTLQLSVKPRHIRRGYGAMNHFHPINSIDDETSLLSKIIHLETQIRAKKERERLERTGQNETYSRIFEPTIENVGSN